MTAPLAVPTSVQTQGWSAELELDFERTGAETILRRNWHYGPLRVQRPFRCEDGSTQVYILHPPGGVVGGDELAVRTRLGRGAQVLVTAPGATKFYRSERAVSRLTQRLDVGADAQLEWFPHETIAFDGTRAELHTIVRLEPGAQFAGWELTCLGRTGAGERFDSGSFQSSLELWLGDVPLLLEHLRLKAGAPLLTAPWGLGGQPVVASFVWYPARAEDVEVARAALAAAEHEANASPELPETDADGVPSLAAALGRPRAVTSVTLVGNVLVCRYLGPSTFRARRLFAHVWSSLRPRLFGRVAVAPRIWAT